MAHNTYFILEPPYSDIQEIIRVTVGKFEDQRASIDKTKLIVKLPEEDSAEKYDFLKDLTSYSHSEILQIVAGPEWCQDV